jgi:hypothetical protein
MLEHHIFMTTAKTRIKSCLVHNVPHNKYSKHANHNKSNKREPFWFDDSKYKKYKKPVKAGA